MVPSARMGQEEVLEGGELGGGDPSGDFRADNNQDNAGLVQARQIMEDSQAFDVLQEAEPVDHEQHAKLQEGSDKWKKVLGLLALFAVCASIVAVALGVGLNDNSSTDDNGNANDKQAPSMYQFMAPSPAPSSAPTGNLDFLLTKLPNSTLASLESASTPEYKAWQWLLDHRDITNLEEWRKTQLFALATFFYAFEGENWYQPIRERWLNDEKGECHWFSSGFGAFNENGTFFEWESEENGPAFIPSCNEDGEFTSLYLQDLQLSGLSPSLPPEIALLTSLNYIDLSWNNIEVPLSDMFPTEFYQMSSITEVILFVNGMTGTIPSEFGLMTGMASLGLSSNPLEGTLPSELALIANLTVLNFYGNGLTGTLPTEFGMLNQLLYSYYGYNSFTGTIPSEYGLMHSLLQLDMSDNPLLSGTIPSELSLLMDTVGYLPFTGSTGLSGTMPEGLCYLQDPNCAYEIWWTQSPCYMAFDCNPDMLCGCDCACSNNTSISE